MNAEDWTIVYAYPRYSHTSVYISNSIVSTTLFVTMVTCKHLVTSLWLHVLSLASIPEDSIWLLYCWLLTFHLDDDDVWLQILSGSSELSWAYVCSKLQWQNKTNCTVYYLQLVFTSGFGALWRVFCWFWRAITNYIHPLFPLEFHDSHWFILNNDTVTLWLKLTENDIICLCCFGCTKLGD